MPTANLKPSSPYVHHRHGAPIFWPALCGPAKTYGSDSGDVADLMRGGITTGARTASNCVWSKGQGGPALAFTAGGSVDFGVGNLDGKLTTRMTVACTVTFNATTFPQIVVSKFSGVSPFGWRMGLDGAGNLHFYMGGTGGTGAPTSGAPTVGRRYRMCGVYDGSTVTLYLDGASAASGVASGTVFASGGRLMMGTTDGTSPTLNALVEDVQVFDRALTAAQVARDYADPWRRLRPPREFVAVPQAAATFSPALIARAPALGSGVY